jgi:hypothetical protein
MRGFTYFHRILLADPRVLPPTKEPVHPDFNDLYVTRIQGAPDSKRQFLAASHTHRALAQSGIFSRESFTGGCLTRGQLHSERLGQIQPSTEASFGSDVDRRQSHKCAPRRRLYCGEGSLQRSDPNLRRLNGHGPSRKHQALNRTCWDRYDAGYN